MTETIFDLYCSLSAEIKDLQSKIDKLSSFIESADSKLLASLDIDYLYLQRHSMLMYLHVLTLRRDRILSE